MTKTEIHLVSRLKDMPEATDVAIARDKNEEVYMLRIKLHSFALEAMEQQRTQIKKEPMRSVFFLQFTGWCTKKRGKI